MERRAAAESGVTVTSFGGAESLGALTSLFQLAGQTCIPVNRWAGHCCKGAGRGRSRALLANRRFLRLVT